MNTITKTEITNRTDGVHITEYLCTETGLLHNENEPAVVWKRPDGSIMREEWFKQNRLHREGGPAWVIYNEDGSVKQAINYINGFKNETDF